MKVLLTGATGFVGQAVIDKLLSGRHQVKAVVRRSSKSMHKNIASVSVDTIDSNTVWGNALRDIDTVIHAAARVHVMNEESHDHLAQYREVNVEGTMNLAREAALSGVKRFIFISSIKVNGERTEDEKSFRETDLPNPQDAYGLSKLEAERQLQKLAAETCMEVVIIRPPLVYGPGVKANFRAMIRCVERGLPLPLSAIENKRSFVALENLADLIVTCMEHPLAANQTFLAGDGEDYSTPELIRSVANHLNVPPRMFSLPVWILHTLAKIVGRGNVSHRLCDSLTVDITKAREVLGWVPPVKFEEALAITIRKYEEDVRCSC
ncbi:MAG: SDR family oxidoreductase [Bacteroidetes bacterium]|nr:MAG: SDR family oxidoreductase [Bacteroidota bacterium]